MSPSAIAADEACVGNAMNGTTSDTYSVLEETRKALDTLLRAAKCQIPPEVKQTIRHVEFTNAHTGIPDFPVPLKENEAIGALKAVEAGIASAIADLVLGKQKRKATVNLERSSCFLFSTYMATVGGYDKSNPKSKALLKDTDLLAAQSNLYRRLSANLYETKNAGEYFHLHGSLEATTALNMVGLPGHRPDLTNYHAAINTIESHVRNFTAGQLEKMNAERRQAGVTCLKPEQFRATEHGRILSQEPPWRLSTLESDSPAVPFTQTLSKTPKPQILNGIKVLELCRIIAGPSMAKGLAEYGAQVIKVTSPNLSDVPFFQVDVNLGKHTTDLDLRRPADRERFEALLQDADVVFDGFRLGALERLGYGPRQVVELTRHRGRGIVYVAENCFGHVGPWAPRPGWQQIADCATGVAWEQGWFMGLDEPVVPPFPMSDYGTGCIGTIAALIGLYKRAKHGGSYHGTTSLCQYDLFLLSLGTYPKELQAKIKAQHDPDFFALRHYDSVDEVGKRALKTMRRIRPELFEDDRNTKETFSKAFNAKVKYVKPVVEVEGTYNGFVRQTRPNGFDKPSWEDWEVDEAMIQ
ncbi:uncharacterized protein PV09_02689 [Verruconis gallopava]|uniref:Alpha-methylacyl-CoA racemase n=1 Tax=Verruconis gallopava TaxID=253628 RepID=A0A0D1YZS3_9PEZI|nr:uncharacterized protein PV09_02689 [Verruconis gallopava]KIW06212.1 hypothetical protein PV09_02689 [Verruconis gallopava]